MNEDTAGTIYDLTIETTTGVAPCQNCGMMVPINIPFLGCVFCEDCTSADTGQYDGTEDFYDPRR